MKILVFIHWYFYQRELTDPELSELLSLQSYIYIICLEDICDNTRIL